MSHSRTALSPITRATGKRRPRTPGKSLGDKSNPKADGGHSHGGDFFNAERSEWDAETLEEQRWDAERALRRFDEANRIMVTS
jgi:hypothetical protein